MSDELLDSLKKLCEEHERQLSELRHKITEIDYIPKAKALIGKCFKYKGSIGFYGFGVSKRARGRGPYVYKRIVGVDREYVLVDTFQLEHSGKIDIAFNEKEYVTHFTNNTLIQITEKEYFKAFSKMIKFITERGKIK